jgi:hypothetical protein
VLNPAPDDLRQTIDAPHPPCQESGGNPEEFQIGAPEQGNAGDCEASAWPIMSRSLDELPEVDIPMY